MLRRNISGQSLGFRLIDKATGDPETGATVAVYRSIDGGAQSAAAGSVSEQRLGQYSFAPTAADLTGTEEHLSWKAHGGFANCSRNATRGKANRDRERIWFSPHCVKPSDN